MGSFGAFGTLAYGDRFKGRGETLNVVRRVVGRGAASRAIVGLPRIGKSSLAKVFFEEVNQAPSARAHWIDIGSFSTDHSFLNQFQKAIASGEEVHVSTSFIGLKGLLRERVRSGVNTVAVLENFDSVRRCAEAGIDIRRLRELIADPGRFGLSGLLLCRRRLSDLEEQIPELSNLANACPSLFLRPFTAGEVADLVLHLEPGLEDPVRMGDEIFRASSGFPQLVEEALFYLLELERDDWGSLLVPARTVYAEELLLFLENAGLSEALIGLASGGSGIEPDEKDLLDAYGLAVPEASQDGILRNLLAGTRLSARLDLRISGSR